MTNSTEQYEVKNKPIQDLLKALATLIAHAMPKDWGFTLMLFKYGPEGDLFYISSAVREDMIKTMEEFIKKQKERVN